LPRRRTWKTAPPSTCRASWLTTPVVNGACKGHLSPDRFTLIAASDAAALAGPPGEITRPLQVISS
jgi:hypothetical protein